MTNPNPLFSIICEIQIMEWEASSDIGEMHFREEITRSSPRIATFGVIIFLCWEPLLLTDEETVKDTAAPCQRALEWLRNNQWEGSGGCRA